jgi:serine O-acetyltransferase
MTIGLLDLIVIYMIPVAFIGLALGIFFLILYIIVKKDIGNLDFSEDVRYNIQVRKRPLTFSNLVQVVLFDNGVQVALLYRCARFFHLRGLNAPAMFLHKIGKYLTNVDLPPTAKVGRGVVFLHCCNIVIGPYVDVGNHVVFRPWTGLRGWGTVKLEDGVRTGLQTIVMDCVTMGKDSESAPGAMVTQDVPPNHVAMGLPAKKMVEKPYSKLQGVVVELENVLMEPTRIFEEALQSALQKTGKKIRNSDSKNWDNKPPAKIIQEALKGSTEKQEEALSIYLQAVRAGMDQGIALRPHARELVNKIRERNLNLALVSRQPDVLAGELADKLGLGDALDLVCGADENLSEWKPQPWIIFRPMREMKIGVERVIYIGGSLQDLRMGIAAASRVYWIPLTDTPLKDPPRGPVDIFKDLDAVLEQFSKPQLPLTI